MSDNESVRSRKARADSTRRPPGFWLSLWLLYKKESILDWRNPAGFLSLVLFALILAALYHYAMEATAFRGPRNLYGIIMAALYFLAAMAPGRAADLEREGGAVRILAMAPADLVGMYAGRVVALWQKLLLCIFVLVPAYHILLSGILPGGGANWIAVVLLGLAALSLAALGVLLSQMAAGNRLKALLMPLVLFPSTLPIFIIAAGGLQALFREQGGPVAAVGNVTALLACAGLYCGLGSLLYAGMHAEE